MFEAIVASAVGGLVVLVVGGLWVRRKKPAIWIRDQKAVAMQAERAEAAEQLDVLREQVLNVARQRGIKVPASSSGHNPTVVTYSDGSAFYFFADHASYQRAMQGRRVPPTRSFRAAAPIPVSTWDRTRLEQWLSENAD